MHLRQKTQFILLFFVSLVAGNNAFATSVIMETTLGDIEIELFDEETPLTVQNFLDYLERGDYTDTIIHRRAADFVIQGGGYVLQDGSVVSNPAGPTVNNEPGLSNTRGTIAMAKIDGDPNSATNQWFINVSDNSENLDQQNGGFTVFGRVVGNGMDVVDAINLLPICGFICPQPFQFLPLIDFSGSGQIGPEHLVRINISVLEEFLINAGLNDAWYNPATPGQGFFITVFPDLGKIFLAWFTFDTERPPGSVTAIMGDPGARWLTAFGDYDGHRAELDIEVTRGGVFDSALPMVEQDIDGSIILEFSDCENGLVTYDIPSLGLMGEIPIERIALDNVPRCEQLNAAQ